MILTGDAIEREIRTGSIKIEDFNQSRLNPNSYNLRLGHRFLVYDEGVLDPKIENHYKSFEFDGHVTLHPGQVYLAETMEYTETHNHVPMIEGRSSLGRLGVFVHVTAGFGDIGFCGRWTLEIMVVRPIILYTEMEICQIFYHVPYGKIRDRYTGRYQNSTKVEGSLYHVSGKDCAGE